jgi:hypothetical protein
MADRYFDSVEHCLDAIALDISERQMTDFGGYLKGFDYENKSLISNSDLYKLVEKLCPQCGKGDILDLLEKFDPLNT